MKKHFTTGLAILLPIAVTYLVVMFFVNILTKPFVGIVHALLTEYQPLNYSFFNNPEVILFISKMLILVFLFLLVLVIGVIGRWLVIHYLFQFGDYIIHKIPMVNKVYKAAKDVVHSLLSPDAVTFKQVVLVPFPNRKGLSIGLITNDKVAMDLEQLPKELVSVFVPATPNPTMGFMLLFRREQLTFVDLSVEEALKCVVSCGVITSSLAVRQST